MDKTHFNGSQLKYKFYNLIIGDEWGIKVILLTPGIVQLLSFDRTGKWKWALFNICTKRKLSTEIILFNIYYLQLKKPRHK